MLLYNTRYLCWCNWRLSGLNKNCSAFPQSCDKKSTAALYVRHVEEKTGNSLRLKAIHKKTINYPHFVVVRIFEKNAREDLDFSGQNSLQQHLTFISLMLRGVSSSILDQMVCHIEVCLELTLMQIYDNHLINQWKGIYYLGNRGF